jgi:hypothetical protein
MLASERNGYKPAQHRDEKEKAASEETANLLDYSSLRLGKKLATRHTCQTEDASAEEGEG